MSHKIYVVMGKSASGKDTIYKELAKDRELQLKEVVTYTTRPIREGEREGVEYHFVTEEKLDALEKEGKIIEHRTYQTVYGAWHYFTVEDEQIDLKNHDYVLIGTLESYRQILAYYGSEIVKPIYVEVESGERLERALSRERKQPEPKYAEMCRRFLADEQDFSEEMIKEAGILVRFQNKDLRKCIGEIKAFIQAKTIM
ncbi:MAG: guanylate kinase [bacterium]|nr:guanylate kinase [bacterium]